MYIVEIIIKHIDDNMSEEEINDTGLSTPVAKFDDTDEGLRMARSLAMEIDGYGKDAALHISIDPICPACKKGRNKNVGTHSEDFQCDKCNWHESFDYTC